MSTPFDLRLNPSAPPAASGHAIEVLDYHTAGEPFRIVTAGYPELPGRNILSAGALRWSSTTICARS